MEYDELYFLEPRELYDYAVIGVTDSTEPKVVYSFNKLIEKIIESNKSESNLEFNSDEETEYEEALAYYCHNISGSSLIEVIFEETEHLMEYTDSPINFENLKNKTIENLSKNKSMTVEIRFHNTKMNFDASETGYLIKSSVFDHMPKCVQIVHALNESKSSFDLCRIDSGQYTFIYKFSMVFSGAIAQMGEDISKGVMSFIESDCKDTLPYELEPCGFSVEITK